MIKHHELFVVAVAALDASLAYFSSLSGNFMALENSRKILINAFSLHVVGGGFEFVLSFLLFVSFTALCLLAP